MPKTLRLERLPHHVGGHVRGADHDVIVAPLFDPGIVDQGTVPAYITPSVQRMLDRLTGTPVAVFDAACMQLLANPLYDALMGEHRGNERNAVWRNFLGSCSRVRHTPESLLALKSDRARLSTIHRWAP